MADGSAPALGDGSLVGSLVERVEPGVRASAKGCKDPNGHQLDTRCTRTLGVCDFLDPVLGKDLQPHEISDNESALMIRACLAWAALHSFGNG